MRRALRRRSVPYKAVIPAKGNHALRTAEPLPTVTPGRVPLRALCAGAALVILLLVGANTSVVLNLRYKELLAETGRLENLSLIMAEQADRAFQSIEIVLTHVADEIVRGKVNSAAALRQEMSGQDVHLLLRQKMMGLQHLASISIVDGKGALINFSRSWPAPERDLSDRDYFKALRDTPGLRSYISEPLLNRVTGIWTIFLANRVSSPEGAFLGIVFGAIEMRYFEEFYDVILHGESGAISLMRLDGMILVRIPQTADVGKVFYDSQHILRDGVSGSVREASFIDGSMRIKAAHRLPNYPVFALATNTEDAALAKWRGIAWLLSLAAAGCSTSIVLAGVALARQWRQHATLADAQTALQRREDRAIAMAEAAAAAHAAALLMEYAARHDKLTGLPNRLFLNDRIDQAIALAHRHRRQVAVVFLDLDGFKHINDSLGHSTGDKLLQSIARRLVDCVRTTDTVSRQGGDEFVVLLSDMEHPAGAAIATGRIVRALEGRHSADQQEVQLLFGVVAGRMLQEVEGPHSIDGRELYVTGSIGVSLYPDDGEDAEALIRNADSAMYRAKEIGLHGVQFFKPEMNSLAVERQYIEENLRRAVTGNEFVLYYQPVVDLRSGRINGAEALIRWIHPARGLIPPVQFITVAEECGLIVPIGRWVLREACRQAQAWIEAGLPIGTMAVNVSALEFREGNFLAGVFAILAETRLDPGLLVLELTESVLSRNPEATAAILQAVREKGAKVAIDDFGTGYSSLSYLRKFPVDILKIDQSFVRKIGAADEDRAIVTALIGMAHSLGLRIIAEGVEQDDELAFLRASRADEAQGYLFSQPLPAAAFAALLATGIPDPEHGPA